MPTDELVSARYMTSVRTWCPHGTMEIQGVRRFETGIAHTCPQCGNRTRPMKRCEELTCFKCKLVMRPDGEALGQLGCRPRHATVLARALSLAPRRGAHI